MPSLFERMLGGGDQTPDAQGLTNGDRSQVGFGGLMSAGALLMAAGQPMWGNERGRLLASLGSVPGQMQEQRGQIVAGKRLGQQVIHDQRQNKAAEQIAALANDPSIMQGLSPAAQTLMKGALASGNIAGVGEAMKLSQPLPMGNGMVYDRQTNSIINPITQTRMSLDPNAQQQQGAGPAASDDLDPANGRREAWLSAQPKWLQDRLKSIADGNMAFPPGGSRDPQAQMVLNSIEHYAPGTKAGDFVAKQDFLKNVTQGKLFTNVVAPAQKLMNHSSHLLDVVDRLGMVDGDGDMASGAFAQANNLASYYKSKVAGDGKAESLDTARKAVLDEFTKFMRGTGGMTDQAERLQSKLSGASTPSQYRAVMGEITELMHGQLEPVAQQYRTSMKKPSATADDLLGGEARKSLERIQSWTPKNAAAKQQGAAPAQQGAAPVQAQAGVPPQAIEMLRSNPGLSAAFDAKYGRGAAAKVLEQ